MPPGAPHDEPQWPPRSPHEALISTPGGRERLRRLANRTSPSPSPLKRGRSMSALSSRSAALRDEMNDQEEEEDEETLQLKLQEIQARLKLKKLQSAREKTAVPPSPRRRSPPPQPRPSSRIFGQGAGRAAARPLSLPAAPTIEVPVSPTRKAPPPQPQTSPSRVLLGIDKGLRAKDISLKRAPSALRRRQDGEQQFGGYLQRSRTPGPQSTSEISRPLSFNERLAAARTTEQDRQGLRDRVQKVRSNAFEIGRKEMDEYKSKAVDLPDQPDVAPQFTREEILGLEPKSEQAPRDGQLALPAPPSTSADDPQGLYQPPPDWMLPQSKPAKPKKLAPADVPESEASAFEPYSSFHLSQRILPHQVLTRHLSEKKIFKLPDLLRKVKGPEFQLPDVEQDIVVFAIVAKKSEPRSHKPRPDQKGKQTDKGKYMVITLCDLKWELELFLFNSGFTRFWKVTEGTVLAILNPTIMPPPVGREATGRFSLVINSDADTIMEVGKARDLGFCKSIKKDGEYCNSWVNKKRTEFCEFHTNEAVSKQRAARIEIGTMDFGMSGAEKWRMNSRYVTKPPTAAEQKKSQYDRETHSHWFATKSMSAAQLIDGAQALADRREKEEGLKKRTLQQERERGIMQRLGKIGTGAGRDYMKRTERGPTSSVSASFPPPGPSSSNAIEEEAKPDAKALGLVGSRSRDLAIHLSPIKRKRPQSAQSSSSVGAPASATTGAKSGFGWGGNLKDKLSKMKEGEKLSNDKPPVRKKTRFVTEKGIREAGRESLGMDLPQTVSFEDDDDDLVILR
ncbi:DNA replication [Colletotrichum asianum]|uniref:DNA replication n=1 Tax=Colletotrichum asianum TaxID=702518 RepID=A0A8H3WCW7_9PEZI|nr:DNA replication [Colletotrichum asianum]